MDVGDEQDDVMQWDPTGSRWAMSELDQSARRHRPMTWRNFQRLMLRTAGASDSPPPDQLRVMYELRVRRV